MEQDKVQGRVALRGCPALNRFWDTAGVAQLVEHQLPKLRVAGSSPVARFSTALRQRRCLGAFVLCPDRTRTAGSSRGGPNAGLQSDKRSPETSEDAVADPVWPSTLWHPRPF